MFKGATPVDEGEPSGFKGATAVEAPPAKKAPKINVNENLPWYEKLYMGTDRGVRNIGEGLSRWADKGGLVDEEQHKYLEGEAKDVKKFYEENHPGGWATAGEFVGEGLATAPIGGAVGAGGKALIQAVPKLAKVAKGVVGLGTRGATEGAASNVVSDGGDNVGGAASSGGVAGGVANIVLPKAIKWAGKGAEVVGRALGMTPGAARDRALASIRRTIGEEEFNKVVAQVENPNPSQLPRTTAATAESPRLGALERGARERGTADFKSHDIEVDKESWKALKNITQDADQVKVLEGQPEKIFREGQGIMDKMPLSQKNRGLIVNELTGLRKSNEILADPKLAKELDNAIDALGSSDATLGLLPQLYTKLGEAGGSSTAISKARDIIKRVADSRSGGQMTTTLEGYGGAKDALKAAQASQRLRGQFMGEDSIPITKSYHGDAGTPGATPFVSSQKLRDQASKELAADSGVNKYLDQDLGRKVSDLSDQLRASQVFRPSEAAGGSKLDLGHAEGVASTLLNAGPLWRLRGVLGSGFSALDKAATEQADRALLDPKKFLAMVDAKRARNAALEPWEKALDTTLRGASRSKAVDEHKE